MDGGQRNGRPEDELFILPSSMRPQTPNVGPLRFNKSSDSTPSGNQADAYSTPYHQNGPEARGNARPANILPYPDSPPYRAVATSNPSHLAAIFGNAPQSTDALQQAAIDASRHGTPRARPGMEDPTRPVETRYAPATHYEGDSDDEDLYSHPKSDARMATPKSLPSTPGPAVPDKDIVFPGPQQRLGQSPPQVLKTGLPPVAQLQNYQYDEPRQYYSSPAGIGSRPSAASTTHLNLPDAQGVNRLASTSSVSTTKAARGSPPPPETPTDQPVIQARFLASGIGGPLSALQAQRGRVNQPAQQGQITPTSRPSHPRVSVEDAVSPLSDLDAHPPQIQRHAQAPRVYGQGEPSADGVASAPQRLNDASGRERPLDQDMRRLNVSDEPPPAYASVSQPGQVRPLEKVSPSADFRPRGSSVGQSSIHPAFANEPIRDYPNQSGIASPTPSSQYQNGYAASTPAQPVTPPAPTRATPPPLPEGWISHLDPASGHYYYIHLPTQSTQWQFPKGPTPQTHHEPPLSPTGTLVNHSLASPSVSNFGGKSLASPGFSSQHSHYAESMYSMGLSSPTAAGFTGPPPLSGVEMYKVAPTNGVYFGPYLRYTNMDVDNGIWHGSIMLITDTPHPPTIHLHQSTDLSPNR